MQPKRKEKKYDDSFFNLKMSVKIWKLLKRTKCKFNSGKITKMKNKVPSNRFVLSKKKKKSKTLRIEKERSSARRTQENEK